MKMKRILGGMLAFGMLFFAACDESGERAQLNSDIGENELMDLTAESFVLSKDDEDETFQEFKWAKPDFGYPASATYVLQLDVAGNDFADAQEVVSTQSPSATVTVKTFNRKVLNLGIEPEETVTLQLRVKSTINGQTMDPIYSSVQEFELTPYSDEPTPIYPMPEHLYIVGSATPGSWSNPVPVPSQEFTRINSYSFGIVIDLVGGQEYLALPVNGSWDHKYNPSVGGQSGASGAFAPDAGGNNIPGPTESGTYKIIMDFSTGMYTATKLTSNPVPANLFIVGDATPGDWSNPVPTPSQQFTRLSNAEFQLTLQLTGTKSYLFLPVNGSWDHKYGGTEKLGGTLLVDGAVPGSNTPAPDVTGTYVITVNFMAMTYTLVLD